MLTFDVSEGESKNKVRVGQEANSIILRMKERPKTAASSMREDG